MKIKLNSYHGSQKITCPVNQGYKVGFETKEQLFVAWQFRKFHHLTFRSTPQTYPPPLSDPLIRRSKNNIKFVLFILISNSQSLKMLIIYLCNLSNPLGRNRWPKSLKCSKYCFLIYSTILFNFIDCSRGVIFFCIYLKR